MVPSSIASESEKEDEISKLQEIIEGLRSMNAGWQEVNAPESAKHIEANNKLIMKYQAGIEELRNESKGEKAYQANCGTIDPNRTTPFPPDHEFCPGNLVCMTNFCGGGMGCPYVCCPKGLPYLNHCDCKRYAASDFDCHSYSYCKEKLIR